MSEAQFAMVSDWMVNGNINDFVKARPSANRLELVGLTYGFTASLQLTDSRVTYLAKRRRQGVNLHP